MGYNTVLKASSRMKDTMNRFLSKYVIDGSRALVIDAETLMTSSCLLKHGMAPDDIIVINDDERVIVKAVKKGHKHSIVGMSTNVLPKIEGTFDIIYLDYCGTPDTHLSGFNPHFDLLWSSDRLRAGGVIVVTFSRRTKDAIEKANDIIPYNMTLSKEVSYCETVPMYSMILSKSNTSQRVVRDTFNNLNRTVIPMRARKCKPKPLRATLRKQRRKCASVDRWIPGQKKY